MVRPKISEKIVQKAVELVESGKSIRCAARETGIGDATLRRYLKSIQLYANAPDRPSTNKVRELRFIPTYDFKLIPRYLFDQIKLDQAWNIDRLYEYGNSIATNPCTLLFSMVDADFHIKGFSWAEIDPLKEIIRIVVVSIDKEYQNHGEPLLYVGDFLKEIKTKLGLNGIEWTTNRPRAFEKLGAKRTGQITMKM